MCLTAPQRVVVKKKSFFVVENPWGSRQKVKSLIDLEVGVYCLVQQNVILEKIDEKKAQELIEILKSYGGNK